MKFVFVSGMVVGEGIYQTSGLICNRCARNDKSIWAVDSLINSLVEKSRFENAENKRKMYSNINKATKDIESFENTAFLEMVGAVKDALNWC